LFPHARAPRKALPIHRAGLRRDHARQRSCGFAAEKVANKPRTLSVADLSTIQFGGFTSPRAFELYSIMSQASGNAVPAVMFLVIVFSMPHSTVAALTIEFRILGLQEIEWVISGIIAADKLVDRGFLQV
jgi:hypothetical protein